MKRGTLVAEIYYTERPHHTDDANIVCDAKGAHIAELPTKDECIAFCLERFGENIIFVDRYNHNILVIHQEL